MNRLSGLVFSLFVAILLLLPREAVLGGVLERIEGEAGIEVVVSSIGERSGQETFPVRVKISNGSNQAGQWSVTSEWREYSSRSGSKMTQREVMTVPSGETQTFDFILGCGQVEITGTGIVRRTFSSRGHSSYKLIGMSEQIALRSRRPIEAGLKGNSHRFENITEVDLKSGTGDWRVYAGFGRLLVSDGDWNSLTEAQKDGLRRWVVSGGNLIFLTAGDPSLVLKEFGPVVSSSVKSLGRGTVQAAMWNGKELSFAQFDDLTKDVYTSEGIWGGAERGAKGRTSLKVLFVIVFGILVGPVNLFILAPSSKRSRLFYTTPLLSLGATVILLGAILIGDGTGGKGRRFLVMSLVPGSHEAYFDQYQTAECGLLLSQTFTLNEKDPLFKNCNPRGDVWIDGNEHSGWFTNRGVNSHRWSVIRPTRAEVTEVSRTAEGAPVVASSFEQTLGGLIYKDAEGKLWHADSVAPGVRSALRPFVGKPSFNEWRRKVESFGLPDSVLENIFRLNGGEFIAEVKDGKGAFIATLPSIDWSDFMIAKGLVEKGGAQ